MNTLSSLLMFIGNKIAAYDDKSAALKNYPVGSYYETSNSSFDPNTAWGGTWSLLGEGQVLLSAGETYTAGQQYGSNTHTLTVDEMPAHTHGWKSLEGDAWNLAYQSQSNQVGTTGIVSRRQITETINSGSNNFSAWDGIHINASHEHSSVGLGKAHSIMQLSTAAYIWHRTA